MVSGCAKHILSVGSDYPYRELEGSSYAYANNHEHQTEEEKKQLLQALFDILERNPPISFIADLE
ncbi:hypothetical protein EDM02_01330 [Candidatus Cardinium hertigii]|uniref:Uncharacterized protein n=1 Tax=Candidatus Cardinium hertigii TaxID=247481 RepID=A0A3N2QCX6_9BACT|nr:hypothetical protein EDM02_01330 [Candidatus Cardinium hertigii]